MSNGARALLAGLDIGTSSTKGVLVDTAGNIIASASRDYSISVPHPGWTEQDPEVWWSATVAVLAELCEQTDVPIAALGLTGQMHGAVFLDADDRVIRPAILWNDQRTSDACDAIESVVGRTRLRQITGNPALTGFQAPKILWLRDNEPTSYARVAHVLLPKDYIRYRLSGTFATDVSDASGTLLLDLTSRDWSDEILEALDIPRAWLPRLYDSTTLSARVAPHATQATKLPSGTPIVAGAGDNAAAAVGCGITQPGVALASVGTSGVVFAYSDVARPDTSGELHCFCHAVPGAYHLMGVSLASGGSLQWFADHVATEESAVAQRLGCDRYELLAAEAETVPPGADDLYFLPYLAGERTPHMDSNARGAWIGLTLSHDRRHMVRAILEGVAFSLRDSLVRIQAQGVDPEQIVLSGGGARSPVWRRIITAVLDKPVVVLQEQQGPAYGAALLAAVGAGLYPNIDVVATTMHGGSQCIETPDPALTAAYRDRYATFTKLYPALRAVL